MTDARRIAYIVWHQKLRRKLGPPGECVECRGPARHWALKAEYHVSGELTFVRDMGAYEPMCIACHNRRDHTGIKYGEEAKKNMSAAQKIAHKARVKSGGFQRTYAAANIRKTCSVCGFISTPAGMGTHRKHNHQDAD